MRPSRIPFRASHSVLALAAGTALVASACGSSGDSTFNAGGDGGVVTPVYGDGGLGPATDANLDPDALFASDPPPQYCGPDGGASNYPPPTGTLNCPSDKNLEGCPCTSEGEQAHCWPGLRRNRGVGVCTDGQTTCQRNGELQLTWGPCVGAKLPDPNGATAADKCECFSTGQWHIENLVPWFVDYTSGSGDTWWGVSTYQGDGGTMQPPNYPSTPPIPVPSDPWSKDDLTVDCAGTFTLCYELKAGDFNNPQPTDCSVAKVCLPATFYGPANTKQAMPVLPPWVADGSHSACSAAFHANGGYGEMSVKGETVACDQIDDGSGNAFVFHRIQYCPASVTNCGQDGSGTFH